MEDDHFQGGLKVGDAIGRQGGMIARDNVATERITSNGSEVDIQFNVQATKVIILTRGGYEAPNICFAREDH